MKSLKKVIYVVLLVLVAALISNGLIFTLDDTRNPAPRVRQEIDIGPRSEPSMSQNESPRKNSDNPLLAELLKKLPKKESQEIAKDIQKYKNTDLASIPESVYNNPYLAPYIPKDKAPIDLPQKLPKEEQSKDTFLVRFKPGVSESAVQNVAAQNDVKIEQEISHLNVYVLKITGKGGEKNSLVKELVETFEENPSVKYAEPNYTAKTFYTPNDSYYSRQWGPKKIKCEEAWDWYKGESRSVIAIIDTGIDKTHEDLQGKLVSGYDFVNNDSDPDDDHDHGTHCAGIAAATTNNGLGVAGVSFNCKLMPVKVLDSGGSGSYASVTAGIIYAADNGAKVLSMSLGGTGYSQVMQDAINYAWNKGCVVVAARGNSGNTSALYPACMDNVISVSATDSNDKITSWSSYGGNVAVAAPGLDIYSCVRDATSPGCGIGQSYKYMSGTSMACPHVAGVAGFLASRVTSNAMVRQIIQATADDLGAPGYDEYYGYGRVNIEKVAIAAGLGSPPDGVPPASPSGLMVVDTYLGGQLEVSWHQSPEPDFLGYNVYRSDDGINFTKIESSIYTFTTPAPIYLDTGLENGRNYYYKISALDWWSQESALTEAVCQVPHDFIAPLAPTGLKGDLVGNQVNLTWSANTESDLAGYNLYRATKTANFQKLNTEGLITTNSYVDLNVGLDEKYYYRLRAVDKSGNMSPLTNYIFVGTDSNNPSYGSHTITIEVTDAKNPSATDYYVDVDALDVGCASPFRVEDTNPSISWDPAVGDDVTLAWRRYTGGSYSGGGTTYTKKAGAKATFAFNGDSIAWLAAKHPNRGIAKVYIDGIYDKDVDLYASTTSYEAVYVKSGLTSKPSQVASPSDLLSQSPELASCIGCHGEDGSKKPSGSCALDEKNTQLLRDILGPSYKQQLSEYASLKGQELPIDEFLKDQFLIKFEKGTSKEEIDGLLAKNDLKVEYKIPHLNIYVVKTAKETNLSVEELVNFYNKYSKVEYAEPNFLAKATFVPNDSYFDKQWGPQKIEAPGAWSVWKGNPSTIIAIIDTGIDKNHEDLQDKLVPGYDFVNNDNDPDDDHDHGTHCAGIAAAMTSNGLGVAGIAPNVKLMPVKVLNGGGSGSYDQVTAGIRYAADNGAKVLSMSLGGSGYSQAMQDAINYAWSKGCVVVAARGNNGNDGVSYPACMDNVISVSATDANDTITTWSSYGGNLSVAAPGGRSRSESPAEEGIFSCLRNADSPGCNTGQGYGYMSGTSMACPHVAGLAGLIFTGDKTNAQIRQIIEGTADDLGTPGYDQYYGYGRINVLNAVKAAGLGTPPDYIPPAASIGVMVTDTYKGGELEISWIANSEPDVLGYNVYRSEDGANFAKITSANSNCTTWRTFFVDSGLVNGKTYYYKVSAVDWMDLESILSNAAAGIPSDLNWPATPQSFVASPGNSKLTLSWKANTESDLAGYNLYRATSTSSYRKLNNNGLITATSYVDTDVQNDHTYYYRLKAVDTTGNESMPTKKVSAIPDGTPPTAPTNLTAIPSRQIGKGEAELSWSASTDNRGVGGYVVYRNGSYLATTSDTYYKDSNLALYTPYSYYVKAFDTADNCSGASSIAKISGIGARPVTPPSKIATIKVSQPIKVASANSRVYVVDSSGRLSMIDAITNKVLSVTYLSAVPKELVVNPTTDTVYALADSQVLVIDGRSGQTIKTIPLGYSGANGIALNSRTNRVYVIRKGDLYDYYGQQRIRGGKLFVIDGATNTITSTTELGSALGVGVDSCRNYVYITALARSWTESYTSLYRFDGRTNQIVSYHDIGLGPSCSLKEDIAGHGKLVVNSDTGRAYVGVPKRDANVYGKQAGMEVKIVDITPMPVPGTIWGYPYIIGTIDQEFEDIAVNESTNRIYLSKRGTSWPRTGNSATVINGDDNTIAAKISLTEPNNYYYYYSEPDISLNSSLSSAYSLERIDWSTSVVKVWQDGLNQGIPTTSASITPSVPDGNSGWYKVTPKVTLTSDGGSIYYQLDSETPQIYTGPVSIPDGEHTFCYYSINQGNEEIHKNININVDSIPPTTAVYLDSETNELPTQLTTKGQINLKLNASDNVRLRTAQLQVNGVYTASSGYWFSWDTTRIADGLHTIKAVAEDCAGNRVEKTYTVSVKNDTTPPTPPSNLSASSGAVGIALSWGASTDNVGVTGYKIYRNGTYLTTVASIAYTDVNVKSWISYSYHVTAVDASSNESGSSNVASAAAQPRVTNISIGSYASGMAVNPLTNRIYVAHSYPPSLSVIDGSNSTKIATISLASYPAAIAVNPNTNKIYLLHSAWTLVNGAWTINGSISVIDGGTNQVVSSISTGGSGSAIAVNPNTNRIYVLQGLKVSVFDGSTNSNIATIDLTGIIYSTSILVNPNTNKVYALGLCSDWCNSAILEIDSTTNSVARLIPIQGVGWGSSAMIINPSTNRIYVPYYSWPNSGIAVIDVAAGSRASSISVTGSCSRVAVDARANRIYVSSYSYNYSTWSYTFGVTVIDGGTNNPLGSISAGGWSTQIAVNPNTGYAYVADYYSGLLYVIGQ